MSEQEADIKVTDRRIFTDDGELREEYSDQDEGPAETTAETPVSTRIAESGEWGPTDPASAGPAPVVDPSPARSATEDQSGPQPPRSSAASEVEREVATDYTAPFRDSDSLGSGAPDGPGAGVGFMDLVAMLAEPIALFLGDVQLPDGESAEDLERARLHIDLLQILQDKSQGNLHHEEQTVLGDLLYRLRMRYVQKKG